MRLIPSYQVSQFNAAVDLANATALARLTASEPVWTDIRRAADIIPELEPGVVLHGGPPVKWEEMPGCTKGAVSAVLIYEGWARTAQEAEHLVESGQIRFLPGHHVGCVAPVTGVVSPSMSLMVVSDVANGTQAFTPLNEGRGRVVRYGACDPEAIQRLRWFEGELVPLFRRVLDEMGGVPLLGPMVEAVHMGDELHNRSKAFTRSLVTTIALKLIHMGVAGKRVADALKFVFETDVFFLNLSMAASKAALSAMNGIELCSLVSVMSQNGHQFGVQVAGLPGAWYTAPAPAVEGTYFRDWTAADACPAIGDSIITETAGLGAFVLAAAPALVRYIGGTPEAAATLNAQMYDITAGESPRFTIPAFNFRGAPVGIDVRKVVATGQTPVTNAGIAHREPGIGQIGAGYIRTPLTVFEGALSGLEALWQRTTTPE